MDGISAGNLLSGLNQAKSIEHRLNRFISKKDTDGNSVLSIKELGVGKDAFDRIDKNGDSRVDKFELVIAAHNRTNSVDEKINQLINKKDTNGDGVLDAKESGVPINIFDRIDKNGDGKVDKVELDIADHHRAQAVNERISHLLSKKDTNGNGSLDAGELGMSKDVFDKIDKDGNGQVGRLELNAAASASAAINNLLSDILPNKESSKLDATV